jgi:hypothetical protein
VTRCKIGRGYIIMQYKIRRLWSGVLLSGVIIRFDLVRGSEGIQSQIFITYPWSMFSVDNPG